MTFVIWGQIDIFAQKFTAIMIQSLRKFRLWIKKISRENKNQCQRLSALDIKNLIEIKVTLLFNLYKINIAKKKREIERSRSCIILRKQKLDSLNYIVSFCGSQNTNEDYTITIYSSEPANTN